jgi:hypothetical protein
MCSQVALPFQRLLDMELPGPPGAKVTWGPFPRSSGPHTLSGSFLRGFPFYYQVVSLFPKGQVPESAQEEQGLIWLSSELII